MTSPEVDFESLIPPRIPVRRPVRAIRDLRGALGVIEDVEIGFAIHRAYFLYDLEEGASRGGHAHKTLKQFLVVLSGAVNVITDCLDGVTREFPMRDPREGLLIPSGTWRELKDFAPHTVCLVLASQHFREDDYIRSKKEFEQWRQYACE